MLLAALGHPRAAAGSGGARHGSVHPFQIPSRDGVRGRHRIPTYLCSGESSAGRSRATHRQTQWAPTLCVCLANARSLRERPRPCFQSLEARAGRAVRLTASIKQHMRSCDLTLGFARCQCVAFGNSFTTSFVEEIKDRGAPPHGLSESTLVWFIGGGNKRDEIDISVNLSDAEVQQAGQACVLYSDSHSTGTDLPEFLKFGSRRSGA